MHPALRIGVLALLAACSQRQQSVSPHGGAGGIGGEGGAPYASANPGPTRLPAADGGVAPTGGCGGGCGENQPPGSQLRREPGVDLDPNIEEAAIVRFEASRMYVLSRHGELAIFDTSQPDQLQLLGRDRSLADTPFELYVRDGMVVVCSLHRGTFEYDKNSRIYRPVAGYSILRVLDARNPQAIQRVREITTSALISDTHVRDDVLYVVSGDLYPETSDAVRVDSYKLGGDAGIEPVDAMWVASEAPASASFASSAQRLYVGGVSEGGTHGSIVVIDISDREGHLRLGATLEVAGPIRNHWQLDEYGGVLRVVSQTVAFNFARAPRVETFAIASSDRLTPLASVALTLARPAPIALTRFDGVRGYVAVVDDVSPPITLDLSDPEAPRQGVLSGVAGPLAELVARGDHVLALGLGTSDGPLELSSIDVTDLTASRNQATLTFDGSWTAQAWNAGRVHAATWNATADRFYLSLLGANSASDDRACPTRVSGVQIVDWNAGELTLRDLARVSGRAQAAALQAGRLFAFSDTSVAAFELDDSGHAEPTASAKLGQSVEKVLDLGGWRIARIGQDSVSGRTQLDVTRVEKAAEPATDRFDVPDSPAGCPLSSQLTAAMLQGRRLYLVYAVTAHDSDERATSSRVVTLDVSDAPRLLGDAMLPFIPESTAEKSHVLADSGSGIVAVGSTLVFAVRTVDSSSSAGARTRTSLQVVDLSQPSQPKIVPVQLPEALGATGLIAAGTEVVTSHYEAADDERVHFFLDRVDVAEPSAPVRSAPLNIPGSLLSYDAAAARALTVDYQIATHALEADPACTSLFRFPHSTSNSSSTPADCSGIVQALHLIDLRARPVAILQTLPLAFTESVASAAIGSNRAFVRLYTTGAYLDTDECSNCAWAAGDNAASPLPGLLVLAGTRDGEWITGRLTLDDGDSQAAPPLVSAGDRAALWSGYRGSLMFIDGADAAHPQVAHSEPTGLARVTQLEVVGEDVVAALGQDGSVRMPLQAAERKSGE